MLNIWPRSNPYLAGNGDPLWLGLAADHLLVLEVDQSAVSGSFGTRVDK
jgi:hypothetical protein